MRQSFEEFCNKNECDTCKYSEYTFVSDCRDAFEKETEFEYVDVKDIEKKLDAIIKHFGIEVEDE